MDSNITKLIQDTTKQIDMIKEEVVKNTEWCELGILTKERVIYTPVGPSGDKELLVLLNAVDPQLGYWYLHTVLNKKKGLYAIAVVCAKHFIDATNINTVFDRFHYWVVERGYYVLPYHLIGQRNELMELERFEGEVPNETYFEVSSFDAALLKVKQIISAFFIPFANPLLDHSDLMEDLFPELVFECDQRLLRIYNKPKKAKDNIFKPYPISPGIEGKYCDFLLALKRVLNGSYDFV